MRESEVERLVNEWAEDNGFTSIKLSGPNDRGKADRMFLRKGVTVFIELKATGEVPSKLQERWLRKRREDGFDATWADSPKDAILTLMAHL